MRVKRNLLNLFWYAAAMGLTSLVPFLMLPILTTELSISDFGLLSLIEISILFILPFVSFKIEASIGVEYFKMSKRNFKVHVFNALLLSLLAFSVIFCILSLFQSYISSRIALEENYILMLPVFALLRVVTAVMLTIYRSQSKAVSFFLVNAFRTLVDFGLSYLMVVSLKAGIDGRLWGIYISFGLVTIYGLIYFYQKGYFKYCSLRHFKSVFIFSYPLVFHGLASVSIVMSDRYFLAYFYDAKMVGLYAVAYQVAAVMLLVGTVINQAWAPQLYEWLRREEFPRCKRYGIGIAIFLIILAGAIYSSQEIFYGYLVDEKFLASSVFFGWLLLGFLFQSLYFIVTNYLFFYKKTILLSAITSVVAVVNLLLNYYMIYRFSAVGVAYATALTWFLLLITLIVYVSFCGEKSERSQIS